MHAAQGLQENQSQKINPSRARREGQKSMPLSDASINCKPCVFAAGDYDYDAYRMHLLRNVFVRYAYAARCSTPFLLKLTFPATVYSFLLDFQTTMVSVQKFLTLVSAATLVQAKGKKGKQGVQIYHKDDLAMQACTAVLGKTATFFSEEDKKAYCNTDNQPALGSMAICLEQVGHSGGTQSFLKLCSKFKLTQQDLDAARENATQHLVKNATAYPGFNATELFYLPVQVPPKKLVGAYQSTIGRYYNYNYANYYGWVLLSYWFLLVLFSGAIRLLKAVAPRFCQSFNGKISNAYRKHVTLPALFGTKRVTHGRVFKVIECVIPSRIETVFIFVWFILALAFNTANFHHDLPNVYWKIESAEIGRKIADRTGVMVLYLIPILFLFAGRNNFLQWVSGWSYARFNVIHHWIARVSFILMLVHAVGMTYNGKGAKNYDTRNAKPYVRWGYVALICAGLMCFHSMALIRKKNYEMFVLAHNVLGAIFVAGTWIHVSDAVFQQFMYATAAIWVFDKVVRLARMAVFGVRTADVQLIGGETLRVRVPKPSYWKAQPLSHAFIYFFRASCFWQSHPFTVVDSVVHENTISMYIKVKGGMSNKLYQFLSTQPDHRAKIKCSVEGPYGTFEKLHHYDTVTYLSGGNGVPGPFASAVDLARNAEARQQKLHLYWIIRHWKSIEWFYEELQHLETLSVRPVIYVTQFNTPLERSFIEDKLHRKSDSDGSSGEEKNEKDEEVLSMENVKNLMASLPFIEFREGRPDIEAIVKQDVDQSAGSTAVVACGHDTFVDFTRKTVANNLPEGKRVDFIDTMQIW